MLIYFHYIITSNITSKKEKLSQNLIRRIFCSLIFQLSYYMDQYLTALISYKNRKYEECEALCTKILNREPHDQVNNNKFKSIMNES